MCVFNIELLNIVQYILKTHQHRCGFHKIFQHFSRLTFSKVFSVVQFHSNMQKCLFTHQTQDHSSHHASDLFMRATMVHSIVIITNQLQYVHILLLCIHSRIHTAAAFMMQSMADLSLNFPFLHHASVLPPVNPTSMCSSFLIIHTVSLKRRVILGVLSTK